MCDRYISTSSCHGTSTIFWFQASASAEKKMELAVSEKACQLLNEYQDYKILSSAGDQPFRILSIGCGDGTFDAKIIQAMISKYPDVKIDYTGVDNDEKSCQRALEELSTLKAVLNDKFTMRILAMDINSFKLKAEIPPCDLILALHSLYYAKDMRKVLVDIHAVLKTNGKSPLCYCLG